VKRFPIAIIAALLLTTLTAPASAENLKASAENITVTVHKGVRQTFMGFGGSAYHDQGWNILPESKRREMVDLFYGELEGQFIRLWTGLQWDAADMNRFYGQYVKDVRRVNPDITLLLAPSCGGPCPAQGENYRYGASSIEAYAAHYVEMIKSMRDDYDMNVTVTGIGNEPNAQDEFLIADIPVVVKEFRRQLDEAGLEDVGIIAPELAMVDQKGTDMMEAIMNDQDAVDALRGWGTHCYRMCVRKWVADMLEEFHKEWWQTESSADGYYVAKYFLSDVNLAVTHWTHFFAMFYRTESSRFSVIGFDSTTGNYTVYPQHKYYKQLLATLPRGTTMRLCGSSLTGGEGDRFGNMENTHGDQGPISAAAGVGPDHKLGMAVVNHSCACPPNGCWSGEVCYPQNTFSITFSVEELAGSPAIPVERSKVTDGGGIEKLADVEMNAGKVTVDVAPAQMITLRTKETVDMEVSARVSPQPRQGLRLVPEVSAVVLEGGRARITFSGGSWASGQVELGFRLYGVDGTTQAESHIQARPGENSTVSLDLGDGRGATLPAGVYISRIEMGRQVFCRTMTLR
jgi:hypothetical protein